MSSNDEQRIGELVQKLAEAEATIQALLSGQIDAVLDPVTKTPVLLAQAQAALQASEERYRRIIETTNEGVWLTDAQNRTTFVNRRMTELLGCEADRAGELSPAEFLDDTSRSNFESHMRDREAQPVEVRYIRGDGGSVWALLESTSLFDSAGHYEGSLTMVRDITERKDTRAALRTSSAALIERTKALEQQTSVLAAQAALLDLSPDAVVVRDLQNRIVFWNRGAEAIYGWLSSEAVGRDACELLGIDRSEFERPEVDILQKGQWSGEVIHHKRDGVPLIVASFWAVQCDGAGVPIRILTISSDITKRKHDETERLALIERLALATAVAKVGIWDWDLVTDALTWDATMFELYGFPEVVPMPYTQWSAAVHPEDLAAREAALQKVVHEKGQGTAVFRILRTDGSLRHIAAAERVVLNESGHVGRVVGVNLDITAGQEAETELRTAKEAAEAANQTKSEFLANISHELRTPMNGVIGMTDLVLDTELAAEQREYLEIVRSSAEVLLTIINNMLDFVSMDVRKLELDQIEFDLHHAIRKTANAVALRAKRKGLELIVDVSSAVPHNLRGDPGRLFQILMNLLGNAIKFTQQGTIVLRVTADDEMLEDGVMLRFSVKDTGIGIPMNRRESIFKAFTQGDGSTTRMFGGAGLGLTIAAQLVQLMGGRLWVESEAGFGSTFHFTARFASAHASGADAHALGSGLRSGIGQTMPSPSEASG